MLEVNPVGNGDPAMTCAIAGGRAGRAVVVSITNRFPDGHFRLVILECSAAAAVNVSENLEVGRTFQGGCQNGKDHIDAERCLHSIEFSATFDIKATPQ